MWATSNSASPKVACGRSPEVRLILAFCAFLYTLFVSGRSISFLSPSTSRNSRRIAVYTPPFYASKEMSRPPTRKSLQAKPLTDRTSPLSRTTGVEIEGANDGSSTVSRHCPHV